MGLIQEIGAKGAIKLYLYHGHAINMNYISVYNTNFSYIQHHPYVSPHWRGFKRGKISPLAQTRQKTPEHSKSLHPYYNTYNWPTVL